ALRLSLYFENSAKFWLGLQADYDLEEEKIKHVEAFKKIRLMRIKNAQQHAI
ncbi:MAG: addiction module antidote protein, HigA family, partial [Bacteroidota bacterium]|nr:addiction module antidote protein, HigA family [Bacteroidota bacterium]